MQIYKNANVLWGKDYELIPQVSIVTEHGKIAKLTQECCENAVDLHGAVVMPAFVNAHCHLGDTGAKELGVGLTLEEAVVYPNGLKHRYLAKLPEEELIKTIRHGILEMLRNGVAVAADYREGGLKGVMALRKAQAGLPLHVIALGRPTLHDDAGEERLQTELKQIAEIADGFGMGGLFALNEEHMKLVRRAAWDKLFSIHIAEGRADCETSVRDFGKSEVERAAELDTDFMVHLTHTDANDRKILSDRQIPIVCCPRTNLIIGDGFPELDVFTECGISWGLGSDNVMFTNPNMFREMDAASRVIRGMREKPNLLPFDVCLKAAALGGAKALKLEHQFGTLEEGKSASFLAIRAESPNLIYSHDVKSSIVHRAGPSDIQDFILDGKEVIRDGRFLLKS